MEAHHTNTRSDRPVTPGTTRTARAAANRRTVTAACALLAALTLTAGICSAQGLTLPPPRLEGFHPLDERTHEGNPLYGGTPAILKLNTKLFTLNEDIDFEKRQVTFSRTDPMGFSVWQYHYNELSEYLRSRQRYSLFKGWRNTIQNARKAVTEKRTFTSLEFALPVQYPAWAQRVLGKEPPKLSIDGYLTLTISYDETRQDPAGPYEVKGEGFRFIQENSFTIRGSIGRLISINIKASSAEGFDFDNPLKNFKIEYKGEGNELEDEVIQEVVAGYTGFAMPSTELSGYSESHEGLFGIKIRSQIGPLALTTIISHEQGEAQKLNISRAGGGGETRYGENGFERYRFFFLDSIYLVNYVRRNAGQAPPAPPRVKDIQLWRKVNAPDLKDKNVRELYRKARYGQDSLATTFKRLNLGFDYYLNAEEGWVRLDSVTLQETDVLAMFFVSDDGSLVRGDTTILADTAAYPEMRYLAALKEENPVPAQPTFNLAWKHVYPLPKNINPDNFKISIRRVIAGTDTTEYAPSSNKRYTEILGITDKDGKALLKSKEIYDDNLGYLHFPVFDDAAIGHQPFRNPALGDTSAEIYTQGRDDLNRGFVDRFLISMTGSTDTRDSRISNLGWGVMKGTELVKADGVVLRRDIDYTIDYEMGEIQLTSKAALAAKNIGVEYQREAIFVPERKVFFGVRGEMKLPFGNENSFVGTSFLYQTTNSRDDIPRIGQEPYSKLLLDFNTKVEFEPEWMTRLVDLLPLLTTTTPSKADLQFEIAHSRMNPNSEGEAYIDDFEASKQTFPLGESALTWRQASPPADFWKTTRSWDSLLTHPPAWQSYWFNPVDNHTQYRVERNSIWLPDPDERVTSSQERFERVLRFHTTPAPSGALGGQYVNPWAGIMTFVPASFKNREKDKYFEFVAKNIGGGRLYIDMGVISEDIAIGGAPPDNQTNTEDSTYIYDYRRELDLGLDKLPDASESYRVPDLAAGRFVDLDTSLYPYSQTDPNHLLDRGDPGRDNWREYTTQKLDNFRFVNGLQGDQRLTSEDINLDNSNVNIYMERFFRFVIDFDSLRIIGYDPAGRQHTWFLDTSANLSDTGGFHRFRIPLQSGARVDTVKSGAINPSWRDIQAIRLWWSDFDPADRSREKQLLLSQIQFVANQWLEIPRAGADSTQPAQVKIEASVINTEEDRNYLGMFDSRSAYYQPTPFRRPVDSKGDPKREQSLRLNFRNLGENDEALVERLFTFQPMNLSNYKTLSIYVRADKDYEPYKTSFVYRFGTDSTTYYEYRTGYLTPGWATDNHVAIDLEELSMLKLAWQDNHGDNDSAIDTVSADGRYRIRARGGKTPTFSDIRWMALGVVRDAGAAGDSIEGELWVNEMKVGGIRALNGWAARASFSTKWADLMDFSFGVNYEDGDFRRMTESQTTADNSTIEGNMRLSWNLDRFLPSQWRVAVPLGTSVSGSITRPQMKPGSDIYLTEDGNADRIGDMAADAVDMLTTYHPGARRTTKAEHYESKRSASSWWTGYDKNGDGKHWLTRLTADRISIDYKFNSQFQSTARGARPGGSADYIDLDSSKNYSGSLKYDLSPRNPPKWTKWKPFEEVKVDWFPARFKSYELSMLPSALRFDLADASYLKTYKYTSKISKTDTTRTFKLGHGFTFDYAPVSPLLQFSYGTAITRDLDTAVQTMNGWRSFIKEDVFSFHDRWGSYGLLDGEQSRTQNVSVNLRPQFFDWLTHTGGYKADYREQMVNWRSDPDDYLTAGVNSSFTFNSTFEMTNLLRELADATGKVKFLTGMFGGVEKGFDRIGFRSITFNYTGSSDLRNEFLGLDYLGRRDIGGWELFVYQLGKKDRSAWDLVTADMDDENAFGGMRTRYGDDSLSRYTNDSRRVSREFSLNTSMSIPEPLDLSFSSIQLSWNKKFTVKPDSTQWDSSFTFPGISVNASSSFLYKIPIVSKNMQNLNLNSAFKYDKTTTKRKNAPAAGDVVWNHAWEPLVRLNGTVRKWPVNLTYYHNFKSTTQHSTAWARTRTNTDNLRVTYEIRQSAKPREIKLFKWAIPIQGKTNLGLAAERSHQTEVRDLATKQDVEKAEDPIEQQTLSLTPDISYVFTDNVNGTLSYTGKRILASEIETISHIFKLIVKITF